MRSLWGIGPCLSTIPGRPPVPSHLVPDSLAVSISSAHLSPKNAINYHCPRPNRISCQRRDARRGGEPRPGGRKTLAVGAVRPENSLLPETAASAGGRPGFAHHVDGAVLC